MFYASSILALVSILIVLPMKETLAEPKRFKLSMLKLNIHDIYEPKVLGPAIIMIFYTYSFGTVLTVIPDFSRTLGIDNKGIYFTAFFLASLFSRLVAGKISDRKGRVIVIKAGLLIFLGGLSLTALAQEKFWFLAGGVLYGFGGGITSPTIFAWTVDLSDEKHKGRGISFMYLAMEIGIGLGALSSGFIYGNVDSNLPNTLWASCFMVTLAILYLLLFWRRKKEAV